ATPTVLSGTIKAGTLVPTGNVAITLNGTTQQALIQGDGTFSSSFATSALTVTPRSPYTITYHYLADPNFPGVGPDTGKNPTVDANKAASVGLSVTVASRCSKASP